MVMCPILNLRGVVLHIILLRRGPLMIQAIPPILLFIATFFIPETPRYLVSSGREEQARKLLHQFHSGETDDFIEREYREICDHLAAEKEHVKPTWAEIARRPSWRKRIWLSLGLQIATQLTGVGSML